MRIQFRRVAVGTAAVGLLAGVLAWRAAGQPPAAVPLPAGGPVSADAKKKDGLRSLEAMTFPSDRNARQMIQAVKDYLEEHKDKPNAPWDKICFAAQQVLDEKSDSFFEVTRKDDDTGKVQRVSAKAEANRLIGGFPPAGRQFYQLTYGPPAEAALAAARQNGYDRLALADISQRFFHTKAGAQATLLLAGLHLDRGNYVEAAYSFERLLARPESDDVWTPLATFKALVAFRRAGGQPPEAIKALTDQLAKKFPRDGLVVGRRRFDLDALKEELDRPVETLFGKVGEAYVALRYGNASHTAVADGGRPFLDPAAQLSTVHPPPVPRTPGDDAPAADPFNTSDGGVKVQQNLEQVLRGVNPAKGEVALPGSFPVTAPGRIVFRTYFGLMAVATVNGRVVTDPKTGQPGEDHYWISTTRGNLSHLFAEEGQTVEPWWQYYRDQVNLRSLLYDNPLLGSLAHDGRLVYVVDDAAIPQPPVQQNNEFGIVPPGGPLPQANPKLFDGGNRLLAVDLVEGSLKWELGLDFTDGNDPPMTEEDEDRQTNPLLLMQKSFFLGPPLPLNGKLYVLFEKNGRIRLACLDPSRMKAYKRPKNREGFEVEVTAPELVWTQRLGEPNVRLPADAYRRFQCSYLAYADGVMVCPTNAGAVVAVDVMSRSLLWARSYRAVKAAAPNEGQPVPGAFGRGRIGMGNMAVNQGGSPLPTDRWRAAAPVVSNGRVVFAAYDSESVDCLDLRTGDLLWTEPRRNTDLYVGGLVGDKVVIVGKESVRAVKLVGRPREKAGTSGREEAVAAWPDLRVGTPAGHGAASKGGVYYLPLANTPDGSQPEVWAIDVENGQVLAKTAYRKREAEGAGSKPTLGNLVFHEGQLFAQGPTELVGFPLIDRKKREMDERLLANPKDPVGLLARGELNLDDGKLIDAVRDLKEADRNGPPDDLRPRLRDKLYQAYTELLRKDFTAGEPFLAEYRALCDVPADTDDPNALQRLKDEQFRRKTLFLVLLAKGREKQGRLAEAFDHYREFAGLGDNKQLVTIYDEPIGQTRPDVWARGRIEAMLRAATDPAARKPLDERVAAAWAEVKGTDDTDKLREFVRVFGPHFEAGREGTLLLADRLAATGSEDDAREAQSLLLRLRATADDRRVIARSIDALARLMTRRGLMDDAVGLYARLGAEFADVPVRDGKTGADVFNDTLTDKRLLPYLEPSRLPAAGRVKATETRAAGPAAVIGISFEPDGADASPVFRRYRLTLANEAGNNGFVLKVTDRLSGQTVWTHPGLKANPQIQQYAGPAQYRLAQAYGHLMLLHLGNTVYCLDVAERRELWQVNVLGDAPRVDPNNVHIQANADSEVVVTLSADGSRLVLGRSALLTAGTACVVTRDGLVAYDPLTGVPRWKRTTVSPSSLVFGDARHVFVVETTGDNKARSRVFRTADGAAVDGVPDFGPLVAGPGRLRIVGRQILAADGDRGRPRVLRLYDPLAGTDVWRKEYPAGSHVLRTTDPDLTGVLAPGGAVEVLDVRTGARVTAAALDPKYAAAHLAGLTTPTLLADPDRLFLLLNRSEPQPQQQMRGMYYGNNPYVRTETVSGPVYCFDRRTGDRRWFTDKLFENQQLVVERFAELPALVSATPVVEEGAQVTTNRVIVADKANGKVRYLKTAGQQNGNFYAVDTNPRAGTARLVGGVVSLEVAPDDPPRTADAR